MQRASLWRANCVGEMKLPEKACLVSACFLFEVVLVIRSGRHSVLSLQNVESAITGQILLHLQAPYYVF